MTSFADILQSASRIHYLGSSVPSTFFAKTVFAIIFLLGRSPNDDVIYFRQCVRTDPLSEEHHHTLIKRSFRETASQKNEALAVWFQRHEG